MPKIDSFLSVMQEYRGSDLHIVDGSEPWLRIDGRLVKAKSKPLTEQEVRLLIYELLTDAQVESFESVGEIDCAYTLEGVARFRVSIFKRFPGLGATFRFIPNRVPTLEELGLPPVLKKMASNKDGLVLVTGPTNSGKSTTLAAIVDFINTTSNYNIITLEDPLEFVHQSKSSLISQRQIGVHTLSFASALKAAMHEDPNVIMVGEMRDNETISLALTAAELGVLVLATLHTQSATKTISRIVDVFPSTQQSQVRHTLSETLRGVCSQQLLRKADNAGRVAALEILIGTPAVTSLIREAKTHQMNNALLTGSKDGMQLMDQHLKELVSDGIVDPEEASRYVQDPTTVLVRGAKKRQSPEPSVTHG